MSVSSVNESGKTSTKINSTKSSVENLKLPGDIGIQPEYAAPPINLDIIDFGDLGIIEGPHSEQTKYAPPSPPIMVDEHGNKKEESGVDHFHYGEADGGNGKTDHGDYPPIETPVVTGPIHVIPVDPGEDSHDSSGMVSPPYNPFEDSPDSGYSSPKPAPYNPGDLSPKPAPYNPGDLPPKPAPHNPGDVSPKPAPYTPGDVSPQPAPYTPDDETTHQV